MPPLSEPPVTLSVLDEFHRDAIAPDVQRVFERLDRLDGRLDAINGRYDEICHRLDHLATNDSAAQACLAVIEEQLDRIEIWLGSIEHQRGRLPRRVADVLDRVDELGLRFEGTENLLSQLGEQILELRTAGVIIDPPSSH